MPFPIGIGDILAARFWSVLDEQAAVNTVNYVCTNKTGTGGSDQDLANAADSLWSAFFRSLYPNTVEYRGCQVYFLQRLGLLSASVPVKSVAHAGVGTATGPPMPRDAAGIVKYDVGLRGPANRGRLFLPFISTDFQATNGRPNNAWNTLVTAQLVTAGAPLVVGSGGNQSTLVWSLLHKRKGLVPIDRGPLVGAEPADKYGNIRRRGDYGRPNSSPI